MPKETDLVCPVRGYGVGFYYYYYHYFKSTLLFFPAPHAIIIHQPSSALKIFFPRYQPSLKSYNRVLRKRFWAWSSFQWKKDDCDLCHKRNTMVVIPSGERIKDVSDKLNVRQQITASKFRGGVLFIRVHVFYKRMMMGVLPRNNLFQI